MHLREETPDSKYHSNITGSYLSLLKLSPCPPPPRLCYVLLMTRGCQRCYVVQSLNWPVLQYFRKDTYRYLQLLLQLIEWLQDKRMIHIWGAWDSLYRTCTQSYRQYVRSWRCTCIYTCVSSLRIHIHMYIYKCIYMYVCTCMYHHTIISSC